MYLSKANDEDWKYPLPASPNRDGFLTLDGAEVYWHEYGNPSGVPVVFVHGGPGGASSAKYARFFDPKSFRVIMFDQRGCGRSHPNAGDKPEALRQDTSDLIADIARLRDHFGIDGKMHLFGGSWGSTLALAYAISYPEHVLSLILRAVFLCRRKDLDYLYQGNAASYQISPFDTSQLGAYIAFPDEWERFVAAVDHKDRGDMLAAYSKIFSSVPGSPEESRRQDEAMQAWSAWEGHLLNLSIRPDDLGKFGDRAFARTLARLETHYFLNGGFLGGKSDREQNYVIDNAGKLVNIPINIVQGRYDQVCPRFQSDELVSALKRAAAVAGVVPKIDYRITAAGHSWSERENAVALTEIMDELAP